MRSIRELFGSFIYPAWWRNITRIGGHHLGHTKKQVTSSGVPIKHWKRVLRERRVKRNG